MNSVRRLIFRPRSAITSIAVVLAMCGVTGSRPSAQSQPTDQVYFSSKTNVTDILVHYINLETVRLDISSWYLSEHSISIAIANRWAAGVPVRIIGDRAALFENDPHTKAEFYWLANQGIPIRLRFNPTWFPEIDHWKTAIFVGQRMVEFGSGNFAPTELAPFSATNYDDDSEMFTTDPDLVNAFLTKFDQKWNDTTTEPNSIISGPPYLKDWNDACANEPTGGCADYHTQYPNPVPMVVNTARLEPDYPMPADMYWGQGSAFNNRLTQEINNESSTIDLVVYRLEVDSLAQALLAKFRAGVNVRLIIDPAQYTNNAWPEYWMTHANLDTLYAAGVPMLMRTHAGVTHMKTLITSTYATNASSNFAANWQRDQDYFVAKATKPDIYNAFVGDFESMWSDTTNFAPFAPTPPVSPNLASPAKSATGVSTSATLTWNTASWATSYDIYLGTNSANMTLIGNVAAQIVQNPPTTYSFTPSTPLQPGTSYAWKVVSKTNATVVNPSMVASSDIWTFVTAGTAGPPTAPTTPSPSDGATSVSTTPTLGWNGGAIGTTYTVAFGSSNPPSQVASGLSSSSYAPGTLAPNTTYYWRVTAVTSGGTTAGPIWSFVTGSGSGSSGATDVVIYATDVPAANVHGAWSLVADASAAAGSKLSNPDAGAPTVSAPAANPTDYFDASFPAVGGTRYRLWLRMHAINNSKYNDSVFVQFSDSTDGSNNPIYRMGTSGGLLVNLATDSSGSSDQGWGWQRNAYWLSDTGDVWFQNSGTHTIRVQVREDGMEIDQIVLSPVTYATNPPGPVSNDNTIVPKPALAPTAPNSPSPGSGASTVTTNPTLAWSSANATSYDISFGQTNPPPLVVSGASAASYTPPALANNTQYFWQVVAHNANGSTSGAVWSFTTAVAAPATPSAPSPANVASGIGTSVTLTWTSAGATSYDVFFGTIDPPNQVASGITSPSYTATGLTAGTQYFWEIVAHNRGGSAQGPEWTFTTQAPNQPPTAPSSPSPANGANGLSTTPTLTWSAPGATSYDVLFGTTNPPPAVSNGQTAASFAPAALAGGSTYFWQIVAHNSAGSATSPLWSFSTALAPTDIVIYASDIPAANMHGVWAAVADPTAAAGVRLGTPDNGWATTNNALAAPADYVDVTFSAPAGVPYAVWIRMQALNNNKYNDSLWVQYSDALSGGASVYPLNSTSALAVNLATDSTGASDQGWGWQNGAYWLTQATTITFASGGTHTMRIQVREDGVEFDQIVLSPATYLSAAPGAVSNDHTIVAKPTAPSAPSAPASPSPADTASGVGLMSTLSWTAPGAATYDVAFGTTNPPPAVSTAQASASYTPNALAGSTTYYWQITAHNAAGATSGPVWSFMTAMAAPAAPASPSPASAATNVGTAPTLMWTATSATSYDVSFGTTNPPAPVSTGQPAASFAPSSLATGTTYFWQVVAHNSGGATTGPVWSFTTVPAAPSTPGAPSPADTASGVATSTTLTWSSSGATSFDVNFGTANQPSPVSAGQSTATFSTPALATNTTYFWQVVAHNAGGSTTGPVWSFTTAVAPPPPPAAPSAPQPATAATNVSTPTTLAWSSNGATSYDVSFGTTNPPVSVSSGQAAASYAPGALTPSTTYFWQVVAHNASGATSGPVWSFTTAAAPSVVIYAGDIPPSALHGAWTATADATAAGGIKLVTPDNGSASTNNALAAPTDYVDVTFVAQAGVPYSLWLRMQALNNNKYNDSIWVQYSDADSGGAQVYPLNSTSGLAINLATDAGASSLNGWGWQNGAYWLTQATTVTFATTGTHTIRIQVREDGVQFDQIVFGTTPAAPGGPTNDSTIVPKP